jgi:predicted phage tail protein
VSLTNGTRYYVSVKAVNHAGLISGVSSFNFVADNTVPSVPVLSNTYGYLTSLTSVPLSWGDSTDVQSGILRYEVALGTRAGATNNVNWSTHVSGASLSASLTNGTRYYASVRAVNNAGLISAVSSFNFLVDSTAPSMPVVSNTYSYLTSLTTVPISFSSSTDGESGVLRYEVALGTSRGATNNVNWITHTSWSSLSASLVNGTRYYVSVRALNHAGLVSSISSFNFLADSVAPSVPTVSNTYGYLASTSTVPVSWAASSGSSSGVLRYEVSVGTLATDQGGWTEVTGATSVTLTGLSLTQGATYFA